MVGPIGMAIREAFDFLETEYGFAFVRTDEDLQIPLHGGYGVYESPFLALEVSVDKGSPLSPVLWRIKDIKDGRWRWAHKLSVDIVVEYKTLTGGERSVMSSTVSRDDAAVGEIVSRLNRAKMKGVGTAVRDDSSGYVSRAFARDAQNLRDHCDALMRGNLDEWLELHEYSWGRFVAEQLRWRRHQGRASTIKEVLAESPEGEAYLKALREEYGVE